MTSLTIHRRDSTTLQSPIASPLAKKTWNGTFFEDLTALACEDGVTPIPPDIASNLKKQNNVLIKSSERLEKASVAWKSAFGLGTLVAAVFYDPYAIYIAAFGLVSAEWGGSKIESHKSEKDKEAEKEKEDLLISIKTKYQMMGNELIRQYVTTPEKVIKAHVRGDRHSVVKQQASNREIALKVSDLFINGNKIEEIKDRLIKLKPGELYRDSKVEKLQNPSWRKRLYAFVTRQDLAEKLDEAIEKRREKINDIVLPITDASKIVLALNEREDNSPIPLNSELLKQNSMRDFYLNLIKIHGESPSFTQSNYVDDDRLFKSSIQEKAIEKFSMDSNTNIDIYLQTNNNISNELSIEDMEGNINRQPKGLPLTRVRNSMLPKQEPSLPFLGVVSDQDNFPNKPSRSNPIVNATNLDMIEIDMADDTTVVTYI